MSSAPYYCAFVCCTLFQAVPSLPCSLRACVEQCPHVRQSALLRNIKHRWLQDSDHAEGRLWLDLVAPLARALATHVVLHPPPSFPTTLSVRVCWPRCLSVCMIITCCTSTCSLPSVADVSMLPTVCRSVSPSLSVPD